MFLPLARDWRLIKLGPGKKINVAICIIKSDCAKFGAFIHHVPILSLVCSTIITLVYQRIGASCVLAMIIAIVGQ